MNTVNCLCWEAAFSEEKGELLKMKLHVWASRVKNESLGRKHLYLDIH